MDLISLKNRVKDSFTSDWRKIDWPRTGLLILLILAVFAALWQYAMPQVRTVTATQFVRVPQIKEAIKIERVRVACPEQGFVALDKKAVAEKLDMPWLQGGDIASAKNDEDNSSREVITPSAEGTQSPVPGRASDLQVTSTADLHDSDNGYYVVSVVNTDTGITTPVVKEKESPWFQFRNDLGAGIRYGVAMGDGGPRYSGTLYGFWEFLRIKQLHLTGYSEVTTDGVAKIQTDLQWRR